MMRARETGTRAELRTFMPAHSSVESVCRDVMQVPILDPETCAGRAGQPSLGSRRPRTQPYMLKGRPPGRVSESVLLASCRMDIADEARKRTALTFNPFMWPSGQIAEKAAIIEAVGVCLGRSSA